MNFRRVEKGNSVPFILAHDQRQFRSGNLYIVCAEKSHPDNAHYMPSGIYRYDNSWLYAIGNYQVVYLFVTRHLRWIRERKRLMEKQTPSSQGFLLPEIVAQKYAARVLTSNQRDALFRETTIDRA